MSEAHSGPADESRLLPAPPEGEGQTVTVNGEALKLDALGPMVVNSDGTLSRIANWVNLTEAERERTMRVLVARNRLRLSQQAQKEQIETLPDAS